MPYLPKAKTDQLLVKDVQGNELILDFAKINKLKLIATAIQNATRVRILNVLSINGQVMVNDLCEKIKIDQPLCSRHLQILRNSKVVLTRREGKCIYYSINPQLKWISQLDPNQLMAA